MNAKPTKSAAQAEANSAIPMPADFIRGPTPSLRSQFQGLFSRQPRGFASPFCAPSVALAMNPPRNFALPFVPV